MLAEVFAKERDREVDLPASGTLLGAIVETVTGASYADALKTFVTDRLGLHATTGDRQRARAAGSVEGHYPWLRSVVTPLPQPEWPMAVPSAFVTSTGDDLARVLPAHLGAPARVAPAVLEANLADLHRHAADFAAGKGFTFTVLDPVDGDVIGCVYLYPTKSADYDVSVQSWVRADHAELDTPLADAVAEWIAAAWPWRRPYRYGR